MNEETKRIVDEVGRAVMGKDEVIYKVLAAILAGGHILLEDIPGVGKTTLALAFSRALSLDYRRVQFTPDVLPADVTGFSVYDKGTGSLRYLPGAALCNLLLADEINRTSPKTQSALLEVMEEGAVTVDGVTHETPKPFTVIATQNPAGSAGTQLLPESQLDRFMVRLSLGYPAPADEVAILKRVRGQRVSDEVSPVADTKTLLTMKAQAERVHLTDELYAYIVALCTATRSHPYLRLGASPRAALALAGMTRSMAFLAGRDYAVPRDVGLVLRDVLEHRMVLSGEARVAGVSAATVLDEVYAKTAAPRLTGRRTP